MKRHGYCKGGRVPAELKAWYEMKARCYTPSNKKYSHYGARGIAVCAKWLDSFESFLADVGPRPSPQHSLDRIDVNGNYEPGNVRWATQKVQQRNRTNSRVVSYAGRTMPLIEAAEIAGLRYGLVKRRLEIGWTISKALSTPALPKGHTLKSRGFPKQIST